MTDIRAALIASIEQHDADTERWGVSWPQRVAADQVALNEHFWRIVHRVTFGNRRRAFRQRFIRRYRR